MVINAKELTIEVIRVIVSEHHLKTLFKYFFTHLPDV